MHIDQQPNLNREDYCWVIDVDYIATPDHEAPSNLNAVGMMGPNKANPELLKGVTEVFRMLDDDRNVYYQGRIAGEYDGFEPLDDFGTPNAGAVHIEYLTNGEWSAL